MVTTQTLQNLYEQRDQLHEKLAAIEDAAETNQGGVFTDKQLTDYKQLSEELEGVDEQIKAAEEFEELRQKNAQRREARQQSRRKTSPQGAGQRQSIGQVKDNFEDDPCKGFKSPREFLLAVQRAGQRHGHTEDARLRFLAAAGSDEHTSSSGPDGGFLVPVGFVSQPLKIDPEDDPMTGRTRTIPMDSPRVLIPARVDKNHSTSVSGGLIVTRKDETAPGQSSRQQYEQIELNASSLFGFAFATEEILTDSPLAFAALISMGFSEEFTSRLIDERLNGTGAGEFLGIRNAPCLIAQTKESGQAADTIVRENIYKMRSRCWGYNNAIWLANHDTMPELMDLNNANNQNIWQPSMREDHPDILLGRPLIFTEYAETLGDSGDLILANFREYIEGIYQPLDSAESVHVRFMNHERTYKFWMRNDGKPWWKTALTPKKSSQTLSPFVVLEARA